MAKFKTGDVVHLKSGGPKMTVETIYSPDTTGAMRMAYSHLKMSYPNSEIFYACKWFNDSKKLESSTFAEETIELDN